MSRQSRALLLFAIVLLITLPYGFYRFLMLRSQFEAREKAQLEIALNAMELSLTNQFEQTSYLLSYQAAQIRTQGSADLAFIHKLLDSFNNHPRAEELLSWSKFCWIDTQSKLRLTGVVKEIAEKDGIDASSRSYLIPSRQTPGVLLFSPPAYGLVSSQWVIPGGMGVALEDGTILGTIGFGISVRKLETALSQKLTSPDMHFGLLCCDDASVIRNEPDNDPTDAKLAAWKTHLPTPGELTAISKPGLMLERPLVLGKTLEHYPFTLMIWIEPEQLRQQAYADMLRELPETLMLLAILMVAALAAACMLGRKSLS